MALFSISELAAIRGKKPGQKRISVHGGLIRKGIGVSELDENGKKQVRSDQIRNFQSLKNLVNKKLAGSLPVGKAAIFFFLSLPPNAGAAILGSQNIFQPKNFSFRQFGHQ
jgi:hypothetical protein